MITMKKLVIVESPNKIKSIKKYLGEEYEVLASVGHIVVLPSSGQHRFGVDLETWTPKYKTDPSKAKVIKELKEAVKKVDEVLVATDPDREGEAIAENLVHFLKIDKKYNRIRFNEITKSAIEMAVSNPTKIDFDLVESQIARRILDRIIGYKLSQLMRSKIKNYPISPSAGRVQSIALKIVIDKEKEIEKFVPIEYKTVSAKINEEVIALLDNGNYHNNKTWIDPEKIADFQKHFKGSLKVVNVKTTRRNDARQTPFKQAVLYKRGDSTLGLSARSIQSAAQRLYEGYGEGGLITYPRTDSTRLSSGFVKKAQEFILKRFGNDYLAREIKGTAGAQDAHEAIRPTDLNMDPEKAKALFSLSSAEFKVYKLVYQNTLMALIKTPIREILRYDLQEGENSFRMSSSKVIFDGYLKISGYSESKELPKYEKGQIIKVADYIVEDNVTKPPARYNDGSLIEKLDNIKVGRPSTFATTVNILKDRAYVEMEGKALVPTSFGKIVLEKLLEAFPDIIEEGYTANMEEKLDDISEGKYDYKILLEEFWKFFEKELETATQEISVTKLDLIPAGKDCPKCGNPLIIRTNKRDLTKFIACSNFPNCKHTESIPNQKRRVFRKKPFKAKEKK